MPILFQALISTFDLYFLIYYGDCAYIVNPPPLVVVFFPVPPVVSSPYFHFFLALAGGAIEATPKANFPGTDIVWWTFFPYPLIDLPGSNFIPLF